MSELPKGWCSVAIRAIGDVRLGRQRSPDRATGPHMRPYMRAANVTWKGVSLDDVKEMDFSPEEYEVFALRPGDVLVGEASGSRLEVGKSAIWRGEVPGACFQNTLIRVRVGDAVLPEYLQKHLAHDARRGALADVSRGIGIHHIGAAGLAEWQISLAPLPEQKRIADKLDALLARVDACRERLDRVPGILKRFRQSVLAAATSGELTREWREENPDRETVAALLEHVPAPTGKNTGRAAGVELRDGRCALSVGPSARPLPSGWMCVPLTQIAKLESGHTPSRSKPSYWDGGIPWIGIKDAREHHGNVIEETFQTISEEGLANSAARLLPARTVCLSRTASVGYATIMGKSMATSQDFANWICTSALLPEYLMYAFLAEGEGLRDFGEGTTHTTIYFPELKSMHIGLPPIEEQAAIVRRLGTLLAFADRFEACLAAAMRITEGLAPSMLAKAFRGELVPQDPNDEPASALLARLRTGRATDGVGRGRKRSKAAS